MTGLVGQQLGQYEITGLLGEGGMAAVYRAQQPSIGRDVAVKVIKSSLTQTDDFVKRFRREAQTIASLSHPYIVKIFDYNQHGELIYLVMELLPGGSLADLIHRRPLTTTEATQILEQIALALDYAHEQGVIHRDLKPENVLLDAQGNAFLTDFGIAMLLEGTGTALTQRGTAVGTPAYMSPEQWRGDPVDARTDIYALGVMLFEMLSGRQPFNADTPYKLMYAHTNEQPLSLHSIKPELLVRVDQVIYKALTKDRDQRYSSAGELVAAFKQTLSSQADDVADQIGPNHPTIVVNPGSQPGRPKPYTNPFFHRGAIRDAAYFVDRTFEVGQILSLLKNGQSVSLIGQRRIGKTSLLFHIASAEIYSQYGLNPGEYLFVYIDCGSLADLDQQGIYRALLEEVADVLQDNGSALDIPLALGKPDPITYRTLERSLREMLKGGHKIIFVLDEFELMSRNPALDPDFFAGMRALATRHSIAFVTGSKQPLLELTYANNSALSSPFFNIFAAIRLRLFSGEDSQNLLRYLATMGGLTLAESAVDALLNLSGPHPLFLQIAGYQAFELQQAKGSPLTDTDYPELERRFLADVHEHFVYYWRSLTAHEQQVLVTLPASQSGDLDALRSLEQQCLIIHHSGSYDYLSSVFRAFVQTQPVHGLIQSGPVAIDERTRRALLYGQVLDLSELQYDLLGHLVAQAGRVVTNEALEQALWGDEFIEDPERLKSVIKGLRRALNDEGVRLENVRGVGYMWRETA